MADLVIEKVDEHLADAPSARVRASGAPLGAPAHPLLRSSLNDQPEEGYGPVEIVEIVRGCFPRDSTQLIRRDRDGVSDSRLMPDDALPAIRELRAMALQPMLPDSTPFIRMGRDG